MVKIVTVSKLTEKGQVLPPEKAPEILAKVMEITKMYGGKFESLLATNGRYDFVTITEYPSELEAFKRRDQGGRGGKHRRHWNGSLHLERVDAATVRGRCYLQAFDGQPGSVPALVQTGVYEDTIVRVGGEWKFAVRALAID